MKTLRNIIKIIVISILIFVSYNSCTQANCKPLIYNCDTCASFYPDKDTFRIGDTLWVQFKIPKLYPTQCGIYEIDRDSFRGAICFGYSKYIDSLGFKGHCVSEKKLVFKSGTIIPYNNNYIFVYDKSKEYYVNEFGIVLNDTGKIFFGVYGYPNVDISIEKIIKTMKLSNRLFGASFHASFVETNSGNFNIYVKP